MLESISINSLAKVNQIRRTLEKQNRKSFFDTFYSLDNNGRVQTNYILWYRTV